MRKDSLNIGLIGYGFMGRAHSNAFLQAGRFFDLPYQPVLKAVCARNSERVKAFAEIWGYESVETDWRKLIERPDISLIDIARSAGRKNDELKTKPARSRPRVLQLGRTVGIVRVGENGNTVSLRH